MKKIIAVIPARYGSTRFPGKPLAQIKGKPMVEWVYERVKQVQELSEVYIATDDKRIFDTVVGFGGNVIMTSDAHTCGTDRIAECTEILGLGEKDIVLNIQGDEPLIQKETIRDLLSCFDDPDVYMGTLKKKIEDTSELDNPNVVKVISDVNDNAVYFSRYCIPYERDCNKVEHYKHIGAYGYTVKFLRIYCNLEKSMLEKAESLEQLRALENGYSIRVKETAHQSIGVDTPDDIRKIERIMEE